MFKSFLCRLFGCGNKANIFSAKIEAGQGFDNPSPLPDIAGWTVWKMQQTEIYSIKHNLGLTDPDRQMHIVATPMDTNTVLVISSNESDHFTISAWTSTNTAPKQSAFMFVAIHRP